tara:strand:+ start:83 stop:367 length:285 start_codon:yes stop_codon:yes gene_type:complete
MRAPGKVKADHTDRVRFYENIYGCNTVLRPNAFVLSGVQHPRDVERVRVGSLSHHGVERRRALEAERSIVRSAAQGTLEEFDCRLAVRQRAPLQ